MRRGGGRSRQPGGKSTVAWLVTLARAGYGVGLVCAPGLMIGLCGQRLGRWDCTVARVLGVRHLAQAGVTVLAQRSAADSLLVLGGGAAVDLLHAGSMVALGAVDERVRRSTLTDAAVETALATVGALAAATSAD
jgi:hypothetical protein